MAVSPTHRGWLLKHNEGILAAVYNGAQPGTTLLAANTALDGVFLGTPVVPALAVDSMVVSNLVASGDVAIAANRGGNSEAYLIADSSAGTLDLKAPLAAITLTPTTDTILANGTGLIVGHTAQVTNVVAAELQVLGTAAADAAVTIGCFSTTDTTMPRLAFTKSGAATIGGSTIVASGEYLGAIEWYADDGTDYVTPAASIRADVDTTPGANDLPGRLVFSTTADAGNTVTERMRISSAGLVTIASGNVTLTVAGDLAMPAATAAAWEITDGTAKLYAFDTRVTTAGVTTHALDVADYTIASGASNVVTAVGLAAQTLNYTGTSQVTSEVVTVNLGARTIAGDTATLTVDKASTLKVAAPVEGTNVTLTAAAAIRIADAGGTPTNQYGIFIEALTAGATADYAIWVAGASAVHLGTAGTAAGTLEIDGSTSGTATLITAASTTSYTMTLPPAANSNSGYQLTCASTDTVTTWAAAASLREYKDIDGEHDPEDGLAKILDTKVYDFHYKPGKGTQDTKTHYVGLVADEAPWAMHYDGGVVNPINALGYAMLGIKALADRLAALDNRLAAAGI